jgi:hypothetical protein
MPSCGCSITSYAKKETMMQNCYETLPGHLKRYIGMFNWTEAEVNKWLLEGVPSLGGRNIIQAINDGAIQEVNNVVLRVGDALGIEGYFD